MSEFEQQAFLLHARPYQDHNCIVELLTEFDGKVSAIAYTGKGNKNNKKALLQPFLPLKVYLKGRNALKNLSRIETRQKSFSLAGNHLYSGFYLNELLVRLLTEQHPCDELFQHYQQSLQDLVEHKPLEKTLRSFEMTLLTELGVLFDFSSLADFSLMKQQNEQGDNVNAAVNLVYFSMELGFVPVLNKQQIPCYTGTYAINHLSAIAVQQLDDKAVMYTYKRLMRQIINTLLGNKPLNSRKFFKSS